MDEQGHGGAGPSVGLVKVGLEHLIHVLVHNTGAVLVIAVVLQGAKRGGRAGVWLSGAECRQAGAAGRPAGAASAAGRADTGARPRRRTMVKEVPVADRSHSGTSRTPPLEPGQLWLPKPPPLVVSIWVLQGW